MQLSLVITKLKQYKFLILAAIILLVSLSVVFKTSTVRVLGISRTQPGTYQIGAEDIAVVNSRYRMVFAADTNGQSVNAVGLYLEFDPEILQILNMDTTKSFCQFYPENKYDNVKGTVTISCGAPTPGFTGTSDIAIIDFYIKNIGKTEIKVLPQSMLLLNDGKGTNIFKEAVTHELTILNNI